MIILGTFLIIFLKNLANLEFISKTAEVTLGKQSKQGVIHSAKNQDRSPRAGTAVTAVRASPATEKHEGRTQDAACRVVRGRWRQVRDIVDPQEEVWAAVLSVG